MSEKLQELGNSLSLVERELLPFLSQGITLAQLIQTTNFVDAQIKRGLMWLSNRGLLTTTREEKEEFVLETNGKLAKEHGLPEIRILKSIESESKTIDQLTSETLPQAEIMACIGILKQLQAITVEKTDKGMQLTATLAGKALLKKDAYPLENFFSKQSFPIPILLESPQEKEYISLLQKRKDFLIKQKIVSESITLLPLGEELISAVNNKKLDFSNLEEQLTTQMLKTGQWKNKIFRTYDVESPVPKISGGRRHPLREACNLIRDVYLEMGFKEMSGPWVESAFWCMDAMWIPQDHPARDEQDTFFIGEKNNVWAGKLPDKELVEKVKNAHENGLNTGSIGHTKLWDEEKSKQLILRTHSTATTFRMFGEQGVGKEDGKYFYISNNFRNEAIDATHLAEFLQVEGFIIGDDLSLSDLMGVIKEFYSRFGIHKIRFKPTFNPYTEPSMEAHYYDEEKKKWYALINSGIFRPEALAPFGITKTVIAWGMGGSRVAALLNHIKNLRELVGPTVDFEWTATHKTPQRNLEEEKEVQQ
jgi:phenylalanyl-tRNA synthetase alpha chain